MLQMPVNRRAVLSAVLTHRRHRNPIGQGDAAIVPLVDDVTATIKTMVVAS